MREALLCIIIRSIIVGVVSYILLFFLKNQKFNQENSFDVTTEILLKLIGNIEFFALLIGFAYFTLSILFINKRKNR